MKYLIFLFILIGCPKKKDATEDLRIKPQIEWDEDMDLDDLPEADEEEDIDK